MRILWTVNTMPPEIAGELGMRSTHAISWVDAMSKKLKCESGVQLAIAANGGRRVKQLISKEIEGITYYVLPCDYEKKDYWEEILNDFHPDIIHAYGTEDRHNITLIDHYKEQYPIMISLQGIVGEYAKYYYAGMKMSEMLGSITVGDLLLKRSVFSGKHRFQKQAKFERYMIQGVDYVEGRSDWDRVYSRTINKNLKYYYCPRMIRESFFHYSWQSEGCEPHSILVHQGSYPIKGLHMMLKALAILKEDCPDVKMYIAGNVDFQPKTLKKRLLFTGYTKFIKNQIKKLGLSDRIEFTGYLNADQMAAKLASVNVCVIPSAIENAPNALAEAMIVGTPCVASYAGGSPEMLLGGECGFLYRYEEPEMLADRVATFFADPELAKAKSAKASDVAKKRHDPEMLVARIKEIYTAVIEDFKS